MNAGCRALCCLLVVAVLGAGCGSRSRAASHPGAGRATPSAPAAGSPGLAGQQLAISAVPRQQPAPTIQDYIAAADLASSAGARADYESATWSDLATTAGLAKAKDALNYAGLARGWDLLFGIRVIDTTVKATPADLVPVPFDSPQMRRRFHALVDALRPVLNGHVRYLSVGNEVDAYLSAHPDQWDAYRGFYSDVVAYIHAVLTGIRVGVTAIFDHTAGAERSQVAALDRLSDVCIFTYYPLGDRFVPRPPDTASRDIPEMVALAAGRPVVIQEVGYPSAGQLSSSEAAQASFVSRVIEAWRGVGAQVPFLNWFALHDFTPSLCQQLSAYYGLPGDANFRAYLCSLGLRRVDGTPKPAWQALLASRHAG